MSSEVDARLLFWAVWGLGTLVVYSAIFMRRLRVLRHHRDPRSRREVLEAFGYLLVAVSAALGITVAIFARGSGWGSLLFAIASGAFLVVGVYTILETEPDNNGSAARRQ